MVNFPVSLFLAESDLSPLREQLNGFVSGLTKWEPGVKTKGVYPSKPVRVAGKDYEEAFANVNKLFLANQWSDGLTLLPPTKERVDWILTGTDLPRDKEVGRILPRGGIGTVEQIAALLAMADGRPEYLPVFIAIAEALVHPKYQLANWQSTSGSNFPVVIVNGPIGHQIRLSTSFGLMGSDAQRPAGVRIGRALRLLLQDMGGATPGIGTMAIYGFARSTNVVFAEDEANLPPGWQPLNTEPLFGGYPKGTNSVLLNQSRNVNNMSRRGAYIGETLEEEANESFEICAWTMRVPCEGYPPGPEEAPGVYVMNSLVAGQLADLGWTKASMRERLWKLCHTPKSEWMSYRHITRQVEYKGIDLKTVPDPVPMWYSPDNLIFVVAGGRHPTHCCWLGENQGGCTPTAKIQLPAKAKWDALLAQAEKELGPLPIDP